MKIVLLILFTVPMVLFAQNVTDTQNMGLEELNAYILTEYALNQNTEPLSEVAAEDFILIAAPGMIENKKQAIDGVKNLNITSINVTVDKIIEVENIGIVIGVMEMKGTIMNNPVPGKIRYSSTFIKQDGAWRLQARTMTPMRMKRQ